MRFAGLTATADLVGRRVCLRWSWELAPLETPADIPPVRVRRKVRDLAFPPVAGPDPYGVYSDGTFPPAPVPGAVAVEDLSSWDARDAGSRTTFEAITVATAGPGGGLAESLRRTVGTTVDPEGVPIRQTVELLDLGGFAGALSPGVTYYYAIELESGDPLEGGPTWATAAPGEVHGHHRQLWELIPEVYKRHDVRVRPVTAGSATVPESRPRGGQLRRFVELFGVGVDHLRGGAEGLRRLHDLDGTPAAFLPPLAHWTGWPLGDDTAIEVQRNELRSSARMYRSVGTPPGLRALVTHYTGWHAVVAESAQRVVRASHAPSRFLVARAFRGRAGWRSPRDAARALGLAPGVVTGTGGGPAELLGTVAEPFALRHGMELTLQVDGGTPVRTRFGEAHFVDPGSATAAEVAAALDPLLDDVGVDVGPGGVLRLRTVGVGPDSALEVLEAGHDVVCVDAAPAGRVDASLDALGRAHVVFEAATRAPPDDLSEARGVGRRVVHRAWDGQAWRDGGSLPAADRDTGQPAVTADPEGRLWVAGVDGPHRSDAALVTWTGEVPTGEPARLIGVAREPFVLVPGRVVAVRTSAGPETFTVSAPDYADPGAATAAEVAAALTTQLAGARAVVQPGGAIRLESVDTGPLARLRVELDQSTSARALGLAQRGARRGAWSPTSGWTAPERGPVPRGVHAEPAATTEADGVVRIAWASAVGGRFRLCTARRHATAWIATAAGSARSVGAGWDGLAAADGLPGAQVRAAADADDGGVWLATDGGVGQRRPDGVVVGFTTADGLPDDDVRDVAVGPDGTVFAATAAGLGVRPPGGPWSGVTTGSAPIGSDDTRAVVVALDGTVWVATAAGVARRDEHGDWSDGFGAPDARGLAIDDAGALLVATASGVSREDDSGHVALGGPSPAVAVAADGRVRWAVTAGGLWRQQEGREWRPEAVPVPAGTVLRDVRSWADGRLAVATSAGLRIRAADGGWEAVTAADGLPGDDVLAVGSLWAAPRVLQDGARIAREPALAVDSAGATWLAWSSRDGGAPTGADAWHLRARSRDPATGAWSASAAWTSAVPGRQDREPALWPRPTGLRVFFSTNRGGGLRIGTLRVNGAGAAGPLTLLGAAVAQHSAPCPVALPGRPLWLLHRSDGAVALGQMAEDPPDTRGLPSRRIPDAATVRTHSGSVTPRLDHAARNANRGGHDDALSYAPHRPRGPDGPAPEDHEHVTRDTLVLHLHPARRGRPFTAKNALRVRRLLERFLPANLRAVLLLSPRPTVELVYGAGRTIEEAWEDAMPDVENLGGITDSTAVAFPDWALFVSNDAGSLAVDPAIVASFMRRTWFPDLA